MRQSQERAQIQSVRLSTLIQGLSFSVEARFLELEFEIKQLREAHFSNESEAYTKIKKTDGLEAIRTPDVRRVNTGVSGLRRGFLIS
jgi:hypothetical protein